MSGFVAVAGAFDERLLDRVRSATPHRGPAHIWRDDGVALIGFEGRRGAPLFVSEDIVVALDARIDNRREVERGLGSEAPRPDCTDAELIAAVWQRDGADGLRGVIGDFAGAVWHRRKKTLEVFRDPLGVRPALYARSRGRVVAASEIPILLADDELDRTPDEWWVAAFLVAGSGFARAAGFRAVTRLEPGVVAQAWDDSEWRERRWWTWRPEKVRERSDDAYAERLAELLDTSVRARMAGARRIAVALSGGLDSTSVAASMRAVATPDQMLAGIGIGFTSNEGDERDLQRAVAARLGLALRWAELGSGPFDGDPARTLDRFGIPPVSPNWFHPEAIAAAAARDGVEVAMDGIDGDSLLQGTPEVLSDFLITGRLGTWAREVSAFARVQGAPRSTVVKEYVIKPLIPPAVMALARRARGRRTVPFYVAPEFARRQDLQGFLGPGAWRPGRAYATGEMAAVSAEVLPLTMELLDSIWGRHGVEVAHPFLDRRVVEFCLGLPWRQKLAGGYTKVILRKAMRNRLPAAITERAAKADLSAPFRQAVLTEEKSFVSAGLALMMANGTGWCDKNGLEHLRTRFVEGSNTFDAYRVAFLGHWTVRFVTGAWQGVSRSACMRISKTGGAAREQHRRKEA